MKQQLIFIHGGTSKSNYNDYFDYLDKFEYEPFKEKKKKWKITLKEDLGKDFEVFMLEMPNKDFADYNERKIMFEKVFPFLKGDVILVGHSLGATFLCKYLEENAFPVNIKKIFLIAGGFKDDELEVLGNFNFNLYNFKRYERDVCLYHSQDDFVAPFEHFVEFRKILTNSEYYKFKNRGHFIDETFPELIEDIKNSI